MLNSIYKLSIPKPCTAGWENMGVTEKGRFCNQCAKEVIDFTKLSDSEIVSYLKAQKGSVCGRLSKTQQKRNLQSKHSGNSLGLKKIAASVLIAGMIENTSSQTVKHSLDTTLTQVDIDERLVSDAVSNAPQNEVPQYTIEGRVTESATGYPIVYADVYIKFLRDSTRKNQFEVITTKSDGLGRFKIILSECNIADSMFFTVSHSGFEGEYTTLYRSDLPYFREFKLQRITSIDVGVIVNVGRKWWQFWKWFR